MENYVVVDLEATTSEVEVAKIIELAIVVVREGKITYQFESLINPECTIPDEITELTGITNKMVQAAPRFDEISEHIWEMLEKEIFVSHKTEFDFILLQKYFKKLGKLLEGRCLCTLKLCQKLFEGLPSYSLNYLCNYLGIPKMGNHRALPDALMLQAIMHQLTPLLTKKSSYSLYLPQHKPFLKNAPQRPGNITIIDKQNKQFHYCCENMSKWLESHLTLRWENRQYLANIKKVTSRPTHSFMAGCLRNPGKGPPKYVIYKTRLPNGLDVLRQGPFRPKLTALLYYWNKKARDDQFQLIQQELAKLGHIESTPSDKTSIVRKNAILAKVLGKYIPRTPNLLFKSSKTSKQGHTYVHIKNLSDFAIFDSKISIENSAQLPETTYKSLNPWVYMQFLRGWLVIKNQRSKTDQILSF